MKAINQNLLGRIAYPTKFQRGADDYPDAALPWPFVRLCDFDRPALCARIIAVRESKEHGLLITLESAEGRIGDSVPVSCIRLAPEGSVLLDDITVAVPPEEQENNWQDNEWNWRGVEANNVTNAFELAEIDVGLCGVPSLGN